MKSAVKKKAAKKPYRTGVTNQLRAVLKELDCPKGFARRDAYWAMDAKRQLEDRSFYRTWGELRKRGEIKRIGRAQYRYVENKKPISNIRNRVHRAIHVKGTFTARDIRMLAEAELSYVYAIIRRLEKAEYIECTGKARKDGLQPEKFYRVRHQDRFYQEVVNAGC